MNILFRCDSSAGSGYGHIMRCLSLAQCLHNNGAAISFVCRLLPGNLTNHIASHGFCVYEIPDSNMAVRNTFSKKQGHDALATGESPRAMNQKKDFEHTVEALPRETTWDWLVVDHYELDLVWESRMRPVVKHILAIDDLGREHDCDLLLDQNETNPLHSQYTCSSSPLLLGPHFALLRPEFQQFRDISLSRKNGRLERVLISMGGTDPENETAKVLSGLQMVGTETWKVDVIIGSGCQNRASVEQSCQELPNTQLHIQTPFMAELMSRADVAVTACGSTTWECCCLGLPALVAVHSNDQRAIAQSIAQKGAHIFLGDASHLTPEHYASAFERLTPDTLRSLSNASRSMCDGLGTERVAAHLLLKETPHA